MTWFEKLRAEVPPHVLTVVDHVWKHRDRFVSWPARALCFSPRCVRIDYHKYTPVQQSQLRAAGIRADTRSNGPAIMAFLLAGGRRPSRALANKDWSIHHIYDGKFPAPGRSSSAHAVKDGSLFSNSAGLVAVHPVADALADEVAYFAWLLQKEAFERFKFDPDSVFASLPSA